MRRQDEAQKLALAAAFAALSATASVGMIGACNTQPSAHRGGGPEITLPQPRAKAPSISPKDVRGGDIKIIGPNPTIDGGVRDDDGGGEPEGADGGM
jgi:hypothetical protein